MEMNKDMRGADRVCMPMCSRIINADVSEDMSLPDYYPEIRRVLCVKECPLPPVGFVAGNKIDVSGVVDYTLVYVSSDGRLCSAPLSAEYSFSVPIDKALEIELGEGATTMLRSVVESSSVRVGGPRRISLRSRLRCLVNAWGRMICEAKAVCDGEPLGIRRLMGEAEGLEILCERSEPISLEAEYTLPSADTRIALAESAVSVDGVSINGEMAEISGSVTIRLLVDNDGNYESSVRKLPFEAQVELDGVGGEGETQLRACGTVTDLSIDIEEQRASIEADLTLEVCLIRSDTVAYVRDAYSTESKSEAEYRTYSLPTLTVNKNFDTTVTVRATTEELGMEAGAKIVDVSAYAYAESLACEEERSVLQGKVRYRLICLCDGEYSCIEHEAPFSWAVDGRCDTSCFDAAAQVIACKAVRDADSVELSADISGAATLLGVREVEMLSELHLSGPIERSGSTWTVVYVTPDESAWSIARRYAVSEEDIKGDPSTDRFVMIES